MGLQFACRPQITVHNCKRQHRYAPWRYPLKHIFIHNFSGLKFNGSPLIKNRLRIHRSRCIRCVRAPNACHKQRFVRAICLAELHAQLHLNTGSFTYIDFISITSNTDFTRFYINNINKYKSQIFLFVNFLIFFYALPELQVHTLALSNCSKRTKRYIFHKNISLGPKDVEKNSKTLTKIRQVMLSFLFRNYIKKFHVRSRTGLIARRQNCIQDIIIFFQCPRMQRKILVHQKKCIDDNGILKPYTMEISKKD